MADRKEFMVEDAQIIFRNFEGKEGQYNAKGDRNFGVLLDPEVAKDMEEDGWNVKYLKPREDDEDPVEQPWIQVSVKYTVRPPKIVLITDRARTTLDEDSVEMLDWADFKLVDLICTGYEWDVNGASGIKAYVKGLYITINEDPLERKYATDVDEDPDPVAEEAPEED